MPRLSVVIPTYNRAGLLRACLDALARQTLPPDAFEVVVVVDGSTDGTREMLDALRPPFPLKVHWQENSGQPTALNRGAALAEADTLLLLDDDILAEPELLAAHLGAQAAGGVVGVGHMTCRVPPRADGFARAFARWWDDHYRRLRQGGHAPGFSDAWSGNLSLPRAAFQAVGGFALDLPRAYDVELAYRLERHGLRFVYVPTAVGHQVFEKGFRQIAADAERWGAASVAMWRRHPATLPHLWLGRWTEARLRWALLRRLMLTLDPPLEVVERASRVLGRGPRADTWFGLLIEWCYWRGVRRAVGGSDTWRRLTGGTVVLLYHAIGAPHEPGSRFVVPVRSFARQMAWLRRRGYRVIPLDDLLAARREGRLPPAHSVAITFDDGYADNHAWAYPVLRRHGFPSTLFLVTGATEGRNSWDAQGPLAGRPLLDVPRLDEMGRDVMRYEAHTRTHPSLAGLPRERVRDEVRGARADLAARLGEPPALFAYPYGAYDDAAVAEVRAAGYEAAFGIRVGRNGPSTPGFELRRAEVYGTDPLWRFALTAWLGDPIRRGG